MGQMDIKEIEAGLKDWDLLAKLPPQIGSFELQAGTGIKGQILNIASYVHEPCRARLDITYTSETFDYVPVKTVGLHVFRDERLFYRDRDKFAARLLETLPRLIGDIDRSQPHSMNWEARNIGFEKWDYWQSLPKRIGDFELFITPDNPLAYLNGSYIFLDYTDFKRGNQIYFAYNIFRNEIFAEKKHEHFPLTTNVFDVPKMVKDEHKLDMLSELLEAKLQKTLQELEKSKI
ncbi:MAG: hypothetical protein ACI3XC_09180 [Phascolarctobacterium sp.]